MMNEAGLCQPIRTCELIVISVTQPPYVQATWDYWGGKPRCRYGYYNWFSSHVTATSTQSRCKTQHHLMFWVNTLQSQQIHRTKRMFSPT